MTAFLLLVVWPLLLCAAALALIWGAAEYASAMHRDRGVEVLQTCFRMLDRRGL